MFAKRLRQPLEYEYLILFCIVSNGYTGTTLLDFCTTLNNLDTEVMAKVTTYVGHLLQKNGLCLSEQYLNVRSFVDRINIIIYNIIIFTFNKPFRM